MDDAGALGLADLSPGDDAMGVARCNGRRPLLLLHHIGARTLIMTGFTTDICVLFTAIDAHLRDYYLSVPGDCVISEDEKENERILTYMERVLEADIRSSSEIDVKVTSRRASC